MNNEQTTSFATSTAQMRTQIIEEINHINEEAKEKEEQAQALVNLTEKLYKARIREIRATYELNNAKNQLKEAHSSILPF